MNEHSQSHTIQRVMVGTDGSQTADHAVRWAAEFARRYEADLFVMQVIVPHHPGATEFGAAEHTQAAAAKDDLAHVVRQLSGERGHALVVVDQDPALAIVRAAEREAIDVLVVGNSGMAGRKAFLLGNVPNRISHNSRCTVIIVNTLSLDGEQNSEAARVIQRQGERITPEPHLGGQPLTLRQSRQSMGSENSSVSPINRMCLFAVGRPGDYARRWRNWVLPFVNSARCCQPARIFSRLSTSKSSPCCRIMSRR